MPEYATLNEGDMRQIKALSKVQIPLWMAYILIYSSVLFSSCHYQ